MKTKLHLKLLILALLIGGGAFSQFVDYERDTKWNIGFNMGAVFQDADIKVDKPGLGYGFTFGRAIYERPNSFFAVDWRFRYLRGKTFGIDPNRLALDSNDTYYNEVEHNYVDSAGYTFLNNSTDLHDYSLEAVIKFNRLREKTGILFHVFGGIGITDYQSKTNLIDENGNLFDYSSLDTIGTSVSAAHNNLLDDDYESTAATHDTRQIKVMPSLGFGLGYQITPSFSIGVEHRTTFTLNDMFEGHQAAGSEFVNLPSGNDLYHYTGVNLRWNIFRGKYVEPIQPKDPSPVSNYNPCDKPFIRIINPNLNQKFETKYISISAKVNRIKTNNDVIVKVNSIPVKTQYSASTELLTANVTLINGVNKIEIIASNSCGKTVSTRNVSFKEKVCLKPVIKISSPAQVVNKATASLFAKIINLNGGTLGVFLNGNKIAHTYNSSTQDLSANLNFAIGNNTVLVKGKNTCGDTTVSINVVFNEEPCLKPIVTITSPVNGTKSQIQSVVLSTRVDNQSNKNKITVKLNGVKQPFNFNSASKLVSATLNLVVGNNIVEVQAVNECGVDTKAISVVYEKAPCLAPVISRVVPPNGQVFSSPITSFSAIVANVASSSQLKLTLNGNKVANTFNAASKKVLAQLTLLEGLNTVRLIAKNDCGAVEKIVNVTYEKLPCLAPVISVVTPQNGQTYNQSNISLSASVLNVVSANQITVKVNGNVINASFNSATKSITANVTLKKGNNIVTVLANNDCGNVGKDISVIYNCEKPVVNIISPANGLVVTTGNVQLTGTAVNLTAQNQLSVKLNGQAIAFSFNNQTLAFSSVLNLVSGTNMIVVSAANSCGSDMKEIRVTYNKPCLKPVVTAVAPVANQNFNLANIALTATVTNVTNQSQVKITHNGSPLAFNLNGVTISANITLAKGNNRILIVATNVCGVAELNIPITYDAPCPKPTVSIAAPSNGQLFNQKNISLTASASNITNTSQVVVSLNGNVITGTYNASTKMVTAPISLIEGNNTIKVTAQNACGNDEKTINVTFKCNKPKINFVNQNGVRSVAPTASTTITASVTNVTASNQIVVKLNGVVVPHNFDVATGILSISTTLKEGKNTIDVVATNNCGNDAQNLVINYTAPCVAPILSISSPMSGLVVNTNSITVTGTALNLASQSQLTIKLNGAVKAVSYNVNAKTYSASLSLKEGVNTILVNAVNNCGSDSKTVTITYKKPCVNPTVIIANPVNQQKFTNGNVSFSAVTTNITLKSQISVKLNGTATAFTFNATTKKVSGVVNVVNGSNTIMITVQNECGTSTKEVVFTKTVPCINPTVIIANPVNQQKFTNGSVSFSAVTTNITLKSQISVNLNGTATAFTFNATTKKVSGVVNAVNGSNTIMITVQNECGTSTKEVVFTKSVPCVNPIARINTPFNGKVVKKAPVQVTGKVENITAKNQMVLKLNGAVQSFNFNPSAKNFNANLTLVPGENTIEVVGTNACGTDSKIVKVTYTIPCVNPTVVISSPANQQKVTSGSVSFSAVTTSITLKSQISVKLNGTSTAFTFNATTKKISGVVNAVNGSNTIMITVQNECGTSTKEVVFTKSAPCVNPTVIISSPANQQKVTNGSVSFSAATTNITLKNQISVKLNGTATAFTFNSTTKKVSGVVNVVNGSNTIMITVQNECGTSTKEVVFTKSTPCVNPIARINTPFNGKVLKKAPVQVTGKVENITAKNQMVLKLNGAVQSFNFNPSAKNFNANLTLVPGENTIEVVGTNACGTGNKIVKVTYDKVCVKPVITITSPENNTSVLVGAVAVTGSVQEIAAQGQMTLKANGVNQQFSYNSGSKKFMADVMLTDGANTIVITATNDCGTTTKTITVNYNACKTPTVSILRPANNSNVTSTQVSYSATVMHATAKNQIKVTVNGSVASFTYDASKNLVSGFVTPQNGNNAIAITVRNNCGAAEKEVLFTKTCVKPTLSIQQPQNRATINVKTAPFAATVTNVTSKSQLTLTVNGRKVPFNLSGNQVTATLTGLIAGGNNIFLKAVTPCGTAGREAFISVHEIKPSIIVTSPTSDSTSTGGAIFKFSGTVEGIENKAGLSFFVNGAVLKAFTFKSIGASKFQFNAEASLTKGANVIEIKAINKYANAQTKTLKVNFIQASGPKAVSPVKSRTPIKTGIKSGVGSSMRK